MNAFLPWLGGKRRLAATIAERLERIPHRRYVEPFCGAAHVFFRKEPAAEEVLSDANAELVVLFRVVQRHLEEFVRCFRWFLVSRDEFERCKLAANGTLKVDGEELDKLLDMARSAGSWEQMGALDVMFYANVDGRERKVEAFGCKLKAPGLSINADNAEDVLHEIAYDVTGEDFVKVNGVPLAAPRR